LIQNRGILDHAVSDSDGAHSDRNSMKLSGCYNYDITKSKSTVRSNSTYEFTRS
jgi:hypothetical protein